MCSGYNPTILLCMAWHARRVPHMLLGPTSSRWVLCGAKSGVWAELPVPRASSCVHAWQGNISNWWSTASFAYATAVVCSALVFGQGAARRTVQWAKGVAGSRVLSPTRGGRLPCVCCMFCTGQDGSVKVHDLTPSLLKTQRL